MVRADADDRIDAACLKTRDENLKTMARDIDISVEVLGDFVAGKASRKPYDPDRHPVERLCRVRRGRQPTA